MSIALVVGALVAVPALIWGLYMGADALTNAALRKRYPKLGER